MLGALLYFWWAFLSAIVGVLVCVWMDDYDRAAPLVVSRRIRSRRKQ